MLLGKGAERRGGLGDLKKEKVWNSLLGEWENQWDITWLHWHLSEVYGPELKDHLLEDPTYTVRKKRSKD